MVNKQQLIALGYRYLGEVSTRWGQASLYMSKPFAPTGSIFDYSVYQFEDHFKWFLAPEKFLTMYSLEDLQALHRLHTKEKLEI